MGKQKAVDVKIKCNNRNFGDSLRGVRKQCWCVEQAPDKSSTFERPLIKGALATNTAGECHPCIQFFGKEVNPVTQLEVTPLAKDIMGDHVPKNMGVNNLKNNPGNQLHVGDIKMKLSEMSRNLTSVRRRRRRSTFIQNHELNM